MSNNTEQELLATIAENTRIIAEKTSIIRGLLLSLFIVWVFGLAVSLLAMFIGF